MYSYGFEIPTNVLSNATDTHPRLIMVLCFGRDTDSLFLNIEALDTSGDVCNDSMRRSCNHRDSN